MRDGTMQSRVRTVILCFLVILVYARCKGLIAREKSAAAKDAIKYLESISAIVEYDKAGHVVFVNLGKCKIIDQDLKKISVFRELRTLSLWSTPIRNLKELRNLRKLKYL